jgi:hypothetical protein
MRGWYSGWKGGKGAIMRKLLGAEAVLLCLVLSTYTFAQTGSEDFIRQVFFGPDGTSVTGIDNVSIPGLIGANQTTARTLLTDLAQRGENGDVPLCPHFSAFA